VEYSAFDLARYILKKCIDEDHPIANLQLQKILYCIQEGFLKEKGCRAFADPLRVSSCGAYVPSIYTEYGVHEISTIVWIPDENDIISIDDKDKVLIDSIVEEEMKLTLWQSMDKTWREGGLWREVYDKGKGDGKEITVEMIKEYLQKQQKPTEKKPTVNKDCVRFVLQKLKELFSV
jgi:uncharacterized phage-associated protein